MEQSQHGRERQPLSSSLLPGVRQCRGGPIGTGGNHALKCIVLFGSDFGLTSGALTGCEALSAAFPGGDTLDTCEGDSEAVGDLRVGVQGIVVDGMGNALAQVQGESFHAIIIRYPQHIWR